MNLFFYFAVYLFKLKLILFYNKVVYYYYIFLIFSLILYDASESPQTPVFKIIKEYNATTTTNNNNDKINNFFLSRVRRKFIDWSDNYIRGFVPSRRVGCILSTADKEDVELLTQDLILDCKYVFE